MKKYERGCHNCKHQEIKPTREPCKECIYNWQALRKHSTNWEPVLVDAETVDSFIDIRKVGDKEDE